MMQQEIYELKLENECLRRLLDEEVKTKTLAPINMSDASNLVSTPADALHLRAQPDKLRIRVLISPAKHPSDQIGV